MIFENTNICKGNLSGFSEVKCKYDVDLEEKLPEGPLACSKINKVDATQNLSKILELQELTEMWLKNESFSEQELRELAEAIIEETNFCSTHKRLIELAAEARKNRQELYDSIVNSAKFKPQYFKLALNKFLNKRSQQRKVNVFCLDPSGQLKAVNVGKFSRYQPEGRQQASINIANRLTLRNSEGKALKRRGVMLTVTYDPKRTCVFDAWKNYGKHLRKLLDCINSKRRRVKLPKLSYFWVVEPHKEAWRYDWGLKKSVIDNSLPPYPHIHIFFPDVMWVEHFSTLEKWWGRGWVGFESKETKAKKKYIPLESRSQRDETIDQQGYDGWAWDANPGGYIAKYVNKLEAWSDEALTMLWLTGSRMYGYSLDLKNPEKEAPREKNSFLFGTSNLSKTIEFILGYSNGTHFLPSCPKEIFDHDEYLSNKWSKIWKKNLPPEQLLSDRDFIQSYEQFCELGIDSDLDSSFNFGGNSNENLSL